MQKDIDHQTQKSAVQCPAHTWHNLGVGDSGRHQLRRAYRVYYYGLRILGLAA